MSDFKLVTENEPEIGLEVIGYSEEWIHPDFNIEGVRICFRNDAGDWHSAAWIDYHDYYASYDTSDDNEVIEGYTEPFNLNTPPTHYFVVPKSPAPAPVES